MKPNQILMLTLLLFGVSPAVFDDGADGRVALAGIGIADEVP